MLKEKGIAASPRAVIDDVKLLSKYGFEVKYYKKKSYYYYIVDRAFDVPELKILIDAVYAANFIPEDKTARLIDKIAALAGDAKAEVLKRNIICYDTAKHSNKYILYNIDTILEAIEKENRISFLYFNFDTSKKKVYRRNGAEYFVTPVALVYSNDNYYLIAYSKQYGSYSHYRVDRMERVSVIESKAKPAESKAAEFNPRAHKQKVFSMFLGEEKEVELTVADECVDSIIDRFGESVNIIRTGGGCFKVRVNVQVSHIFLGWCLMSQGKIRITAPQEIAAAMDKFKEAILKA
jgi:predicted DNA-binding transcriptional regulator YafY